MARKDQIQIALAALGKDAGDVDFKDYLHALSALKKYLVAVGEGLKVNDINWIVKDLHHSEPTMLLEGRSEENTDRVQSVIDLSMNSLKLMGTGKDAPDLNDDALKAVKDLLSGIGKGLLSAKLEAKDTTQEIDINFQHTFRQVKFANETFDEEWQGMLEEVNLHGTKNTFRLYPAAGPKYITCEFTDDLIVTVKQLLERKVMVLGDALYRPKSKFPHRIKVRNIEGIKSDNKDISLMKGDDSTLSENLGSLDELRSGWGE